MTVPYDPHNLPPQKPSKQPIDKLSVIEKKKSHKGENRFSKFNKFVDVSMRGLTSLESLIYIILWRFEKNGVVQISYKQIAQLSGFSPRSIPRAIKNLVDEELISVIKQGNNFQHESSIYKLV